jgi:serine/threonine protein kinase
MIRNNKYQEMQSSKEIASGAYGCVYLPPLLCSRQKKASHNSSYLTKAQLNPYAEKELQITQPIREIPNWRYYFIIPENNICHPTTRNMPLLGKCEAIEDRNRTNISLYHMKYGGVPLASADIQLNKFNIRFFLKHLLEAVDLLHSKDLVHADLHTNNILIDDKNIPRIIDFGQMTKLSESDPEQILKTFYVFDQGYEQMPPECLLFSGKLKYPGADYRLLLKHVFRMRRVFKELKLILNYSTEKQVEHLSSWWKSTNESINVQEFWKQMGPTFDVWSIGVITLHLISKFMLWPGYKPDLEVLSVLRKICHLDPRRRWSAKQALWGLSNPA